MLTRTRSFAHITLPVGGADHGREDVGDGMLLHYGANDCCVEVESLA
jgi:hypothetical protein